MRPILPVLLLLTSTALAQNPGYTLRTQSNIVLVPTTVETRHGDVLYTLKENQFVVEDDGVPQKIHLDQDTDSLGLSLVVVVQCSRSAGFEYAKLGGLSTLINAMVGGAPHEVAVVEYGGKPVLVDGFTRNPDHTASALSRIQPCDNDPDASTYDAVSYATGMLEARNDHNRHAILLISETRDHGSTTKPAQVIAMLGRTNTIVDAVAFGPGKTEVLNDLRYGGGSGPIGLLVMAINALKKNAAHTLAALSGGEYINFTTQKGFEQGLNRLTNHVHNYYLLSFTPQPGPNGEPSPGMHSIRVHVPDYPDARIRFRESYFAGQLDSSTSGNN
ncbi:hypothetical protein GCM10011507_21230 [Edaphobacter acidisoli]|uniref:VWA domain-containing protein n=1 Tax=Edaphobacter acidisoli TaxID=2040573 RepID=A0A916RTD8_9BACT|nr:VWA domain-containing protein [Edaphobacter acidisoli]GGA69470.1 hypothetical protein GCM10011507_21230 [Edaphobacter acidisoli]